MKRRNRGFTLLETLLVLAIGATFFVMGLRMYQSFQNDNDVLALQANVDMLFDAMSKYYRANCYGVTYPSNPATFGQLTSGALNPNGGTPAQSFIIPLSSLTNQGFITGTLEPVSFIFNIEPQFVAQPQNYRGVNLSAGGASTGAIYNWTMMVAMQIQSSVIEKNPDAPNVYLALTNADCLSQIAMNSSGGLYISPCSANTGGPYLVWERLPSYPAQQLPSNLWLSNPLVKQFNQMYTTYPITYLIGSGGKTANGGQQYYACGS